MTFKILTIDGGGYRGLYAAHILKRVEETYGLKCGEHFDLIAGTSTGSIIASGLALGKSADRMVDLYKNSGEKIFRPKRFGIMGIFRSRYSLAGLKKIIEKEFGNITLGQIKTPLIIPSTDIGNGCVHVFKTKYHNEFVRDENTKVIDAVLASCSAPTYFDPHYANEYLLADGGLWANNPTLVALTDARKRLNISLKDIKILSIGTGNGKKFYSLDKSILSWGFATRWRGPKFIQLLLNLQSQNADNTTRLLLGDNQLLRINFDSDQDLPLDKPSMQKDLITKADKDFSYNSEKIREFLEI